MNPYILNLKDQTGRETKIKAMQGCKNTFIIVDDTGKALPLMTSNKIDGSQHDNYKAFAEDFLSRSDFYPRYQFYPDGFLFVANSQIADFKMKYYDVHKSKGTVTTEKMCGNGLRCFTKYLFDHLHPKQDMRIETDDGIKEALITHKGVRINLGFPRRYTSVSDNLYFVDTSVRHLVHFVQALPYDDVEYARIRGKEIRFDQKIIEKVGPSCVNFVKIKSTSEIAILTYETGVEDITQACGTGATAAAYVAAKEKGLQFPITVENRGGFLIVNQQDGQLYLEGPTEYL